MPCDSKACRLSDECKQVYPCSYPPCAPEGSCTQPASPNNARDEILRVDKKNYPTARNQKLFNHMAGNYDLTLQESEMHEIIQLCRPIELCLWTGDGEGNYSTDCGDCFCVIDGTPHMNGMRYCPYCGKRLRVVKN